MWKRKKSLDDESLVHSSDQSSSRPMLSNCCVCSDERGWDENPLVYCDGQGCNVAVHQACYGIVTVPSGPWFCRKCESQERSTRVRCELCPSRDGALKRTDGRSGSGSGSGSGWAHVVCALYIPEVRFGNVTTMEPILISLIPSERFSKTCYICEENERGQRNVGACMQCNKPGCKQNFHVTCAQMLGLLCEEAGNMMDNVKYCGYCQYHYSKLKKTSNMKIIPPFRPVPNSPIQGGGGGVQGGLEGTNPVVVLNKDLSPDINMKAMKKKMPGSSSSSTSSKSGSTSAVNNNNNNNSSSTIPRIAPSNLFSAGAFSSSLAGGKSSSSDRDSALGGGGGGDSQQQQPLVPKTEDSFVLKSEDLKNPSSSLNNNNTSNGEKGGGGGGGGGRKWKTSDFMTVKLNDVLTASLDRPIHESNPPPSSSSTSSSERRDKSQPPDIKPHVTLTPIPMRSNDKLLGGGGKPDGTKASILFGGQSSGGGGQPATISGVSVAKLKESPDNSDKPTAEISPTSFSSAGEKKRSRLGLVDFESGMTDSSQNNDGRDRSGGNSSAWDLKQPSSTGQQQNSSERHMLHSSNSGAGGDDDDDMNSHQQTQQSQIPMKRGPGRPVKRRTGPGREDERLEEEKLKKKSKRGGRRGGGSYNRRDMREDNLDGNNTPPLQSANSNNYNMDDDSMDGKKMQLSNSNPRKSQNAALKRPEDPPAPTLSQLKAQMDAAKQQQVQNDYPNTSSSVLPTDLFGNAINPASSMAQRMVDTLSQEMETIVAADKVEKPTEKIVGIPLPKGSACISHQSSSSSSSVVSNGGTTATTPPQTLEQLLERQWEQGSQFLMEQAQHLDIAQLLSCLNQLKQDNRALEEHVCSLIHRKEQLIAINARLSIPLGSSVTLGAVGGSDRFHHDGPALPIVAPPPRNNSVSDLPILHPQQPPPPSHQQSGSNRQVNYNGHPVSVVVNSHPSPHQGHGSSRDSR